MSKTLARKDNLGKKRSGQEWMALHRDYKQSGLSRDEFCRQNNLSVYTFRDAVKRHKKNTNSQFIEVTPVTSATQEKTWALELELPSGIKLRMREV